MFNITLSDDENETEYDAIILTKFDVFIVEVKNFRGDLNISERGIVTNSFNDKVTYNLAEKMSCKEYFIKKTY
ncbi:nuclease-related domain-containing protein [Thomasclavelia spiroformis]|uniref:nuclease-related domain-containing protein n=1 Tax=Thomasclavelia spiroformis TaxID=29348 RepID=UPI001178B12A|nr:nuclease-related domain-containing protein [Thomasclavelia spiroformis]